MNEITIFLQSGKEITVRSKWENPKKIFGSLLETNKIWILDKMNGFLTDYDYIVNRKKIECIKIKKI